MRPFVNDFNQDLQRHLNNEIKNKNQNIEFRQDFSGKPLTNSDKRQEEKVHYWSERTVTVYHQIFFSDAYHFKGKESYQGHKKDENCLADGIKIQNSKDINNRAKTDYIG